MCYLMKMSYRPLCLGSLQKFDCLQYACFALDSTALSISVWKLHVFLLASIESRSSLGAKSGRRKGVLSSLLPVQNSSSLQDGKFHWLIWDGSYCLTKSSSPFFSNWEMKIANIGQDFAIDKTSPLRLEKMSAKLDWSTMNELNCMSRG